MSLDFFPRGRGSAFPYTIIRSSVNVLALVSGTMSASYLTDYLGKEEKRDDAKIGLSSDGKSFHLRNEGTPSKELLGQNQNSTTKSNKPIPKTEHVPTNTLALTESFFQSDG